MSTANPTPRFRPLTPKDMEEYRKELEVTQAAAAAQNPEIEDPITPEDVVVLDPQEPNSPALTAAEIEELKQYKKRFADQTTYLNEQIRLRKDAEKKAEEADQKLKTKAQQYASDEDVQDFETKVETTPILKELMRRQTEEAKTSLRAELRAELDAEKKLSRKQIEDTAKLSKAHADWREYDSGAPLNKIFNDWLNTQPMSIRKMADYTSNTHEEDAMDNAIAVLSMFKAQVQVKTGPNKKPTATNPAPNSRPDIPAPREGKFDMVKWEKEIGDALRLRDRPLQDKLMADMNKAKAEGRI